VTLLLRLQPGVIDWCSRRAKAVTNQHARCAVPSTGRGSPAYPARSLLDAGARIAGGSDWGVSTVNAFALRQEKATGSLEPSKRADFIVLDRDIFSIGPFDLHATRVLATYLDGREVYRDRRW
jgi:predicted amidohydrolase YtcJ